ncbi:MAG TPA: putative lipid II flippase FtsW [Pseudomonadales bacterium]|nr:putative lipid II flippase FtsW [Pseudomonadales bacterium]
MIFQPKMQPTIGGWRLGHALLFVSIMLGLLGFVMVASASFGVSEKKYDDMLYFVKRHAVYLGLAAVSGLLVYRVPPERLEKHSWALLGVSLLCLILVLIPGIGHKINGARRWLFVGQPSEVAKIAIIIYLAAYLVRRQSEVREHFTGFVKPFVVLGVLIFLLLLEPDFGAVVVSTSVALGMLFLGGVRLPHFLGVLVAAGGAAYFAVVGSEYRLKRLSNYLHPFDDPFGAGYQLSQSLIAIGRGEFFGEGLGNSVQKLFYLPEAHTDFVFAVLSEELGLVGSFAVVSLFVLFVVLALKIGRNAERFGYFFSAYLAYGLGLLVGIQAMINMGVNNGLLPTKGLTLPLVSYGGSSLIVSGILVGILLRIDKETWQFMDKPVKKLTASSRNAASSGAKVRPVSASS